MGERHQPIEVLEAEIPRLQGDIDFLKIQHLSREEAVSEAEDLYRRWEDLSREDRRVIVQAIVKRVTVGKDEIEITLSCRSGQTPCASAASRDGDNSCPHPWGCVVISAGRSGVGLRNPSARSLRRCEIGVDRLLAQPKPRRAPGGRGCDPHRAGLTTRPV